MKRLRIGRSLSTYCSCQQPAHTCTPWDTPQKRLADCQRCRDEAAKGSES